MSKHGPDSECFSTRSTFVHIVSAARKTQHSPAESRHCQTAGADDGSAAESAADFGLSCVAAVRTGGFLCVKLPDSGVLVVLDLSFENQNFFADSGECAQVSRTAVVYNRVEFVQLHCS